MLTKLMELSKEELDKLWLPNVGDEYYIPNINNDVGYSKLTWDNFIAEMYAWRRGMIFKEKEDAVRTAKELIDTLEVNNEK